MDGHGQTLNSYLCTYHCIYTVYTTAGSRILVHAQKWDKVSVFEVPEDATEAERLERIPKTCSLHPLIQSCVLIHNGKERYPPVCQRTTRLAPKCQIHHPVQPHRRQPRFLGWGSSSTRRTRSRHRCTTRRRRALPPSSAPIRTTAASGRRTSGPCCRIKLARWTCLALQYLARPSPAET